MESSLASRTWVVLQGPLAARTSFLHLVTPQELEDLRLALARGHVPPDFQAKLVRLEKGTLLERAVARQCRVFIALLVAAHAGAFTEAGGPACRRLVQVLAYVRKDDDALPDYKPSGFTDDLHEVRAAEADWHELLKSFKAWRLRHQVPGMWLN
jgi:hypothetical protein